MSASKGHAPQVLLAAALQRRLHEGRDVFQGQAMLLGVLLQVRLLHKALRNHLSEALRAAHRTDGQVAGTAGVSTLVRRPSAEPHAQACMVAATAAVKGGLPRSPPCGRCRSHRTSSSSASPCGSF